jgi:hypothetical protein
MPIPFVHDCFVIDQSLTQKLDVLREHCRAVGRNPSDIRVSVVLWSEAQADAMWEAMVCLNNPNLLAERRRLEAEGAPAVDLEARLKAWVWESLRPRLARPYPPLTPSGSSGTMPGAILGSQVT